MYKNINKKQLKEMMKNEKDVLLLDVRTKDEFKEYKDKKVVVYCRSGHRSVTACNLLAEEGFEHLYNLNSGIIDYMS